MLELCTCVCVCKFLFRIPYTIQFYASFFALVQISLFWLLFASSFSSLYHYFTVIPHSIESYLYIWINVWNYYTAYLVCVCVLLCVCAHAACNCIAIKNMCIFFVARLKLLRNNAPHKRTRTPTQTTLIFMSRKITNREKNEIISWKFQLEIIDLVVSSVSYQRLYNLYISNVICIQNVSIEFITGGWSTDWLHWIDP